MENGIIPLRHGSLPGALRLPRRYENCTRKMSPVSKRNSSIAPASNENETERMHDLMQAIMWVKQELILMRQHDILLKRQFCDIQDTIKSLCKSRRYKGAVCTSNTSLQSTGSTEFGMDNYSVRSASSVTALDDSGEDEDEHHELLFRPRTSSMKTTRDLAALARRRGSKELI
ncbi:hypothetical protein MAR_036987 [Mya arenaria]|uniref:Uncharacterized protein n=1 Tax=Mya arenaria TaxID=6604 RepID=A0ABY7FRD5_MYAAR|nr:uncharacterized protein LOC128214170 [Mya arenaria]XP_052776464.1 uncharacterized protein LOC128214170 [Mya arenaria]XP_052776465.1 uncharacterized protein LOC128214170 [Mya arenaria]XP_052776466.1 uncharacterized protein LOC128214170 [Mya arenaria]XP_052776468.1 uncharacterized protein LOC128214170 [Mya arenaria]XP_052776469.1 uncharacterized protein LOC128214170 [Mya arenaria]WAR23318.1 hypothetical protein MAR_036987 [Mya arenaria]